MNVRKRLSEPGFIVSALLHAGALGATLVAFSQTQKFDDVQESVPIEMVTNSEFNQIMHGEKTAKAVQPDAKADQADQAQETKPTPPTPEQKQAAPAPPPPPPAPLPPVRQVAAPPPQPVPLPPPMPPEPPRRPDPPQPVADQSVPMPPVRLADATPTTPKAEIKPVPVQRPVPRPVPLPPHPEVPKVVHETRPPPPRPRPAEKPKVDLLAKLMEEQPADPVPAAKPSVTKAKPAPQTDDESKFDPTDISRLLSRVLPSQRASTAHDTSRVASLGSPTASAQKMSPSLWGSLDGILEEQYRKCWSYLGLSGGQKYIPQVRVVYSQNGGLEVEPVLLNPPTDPALQSLADSALRAVRRCNPLSIPDTFAPFYDQWRGRVLRFDPEEMAG